VTRLAAAAAGFLFLASMTFWAPPFWISIGTQALIFAIFAMSIDLLLGYCGLPSFGHAAFYGAGSFACAYFALRNVNGLVPLLGLGCLAAGAIAIPIGALSLRARGVYFLMLTLAFGMMLWGYAQQSPRSFLGGSDGLIGVARPPLDAIIAVDRTLWDLTGVDVRLPAARHFFNAVLLVATAVFALLSLLVASPFGRTLDGIRENERRMRALGTPTYRYQLTAFVVAAGLAGVAGALAALFNGFANPGELYWTNSGLVLIAAIVGGTRSLLGPAVGAFLVLIVQDALSSLSDRWPLLLGALFIAIVLFLPGGVRSLVRTSALPHLLGELARRAGAGR
jgi:branched-chain amino acid transport system permease protein